MGVRGDKSRSVVVHCSSAREPLSSSVSPSASSMALGQSEPALAGDSVEPSARPRALGTPRAKAGEPAPAGDRVPGTTPLSESVSHAGAPRALHSAFARELPSAYGLALGYTLSPAGAGSRRLLVGYPVLADSHWATRCRPLARARGVCS